MRPSDPGRGSESPEDRRVGGAGGDASRGSWPSRHTADVGAWAQLPSQGSPVLAKPQHSLSPRKKPLGGAAGISASSQAAWAPRAGRPRGRGLCPWPVDPPPLCATSWGLCRPRGRCTT